MRPAPGILEAFGVAERRYVHLIGGGGKTSLLFALARALAGAGRTVLTTTTTRIAEPRPDESERVLAVADAASLGAALRRELAARRHVTAVASRPGAGGKLAGFVPDQLDAVVDSGVVDHVLVEADGAAGLPLKAHREHEPVVSARADLVIAVVGLDGLGAPLDDAHVHRATLLGARLGLPAGAALRAEDVAAILLHRDGYLARVSAATPVVAFVNKADTPALRERARELAAVLGRADVAGRLSRIVIGDVRSGAYEVERP